MVGQKDRSISTLLTTSAPVHNTFDSIPIRFVLFSSLFLSVLSTRLLKSQSADSLLTSDMDTAPPQAASASHAWLDGLGQRSKDTASSAHSNQHSPQTHDAFLSLLTNKGKRSRTLDSCGTTSSRQLSKSPQDNIIFVSVLFLLFLFLFLLVEECSIGSATDLTETSSVVDGDWTMVDENSSTLSLSQAELEHISMELANKGPHKSQVQLR